MAIPPPPWRLIEPSGKESFLTDAQVLTIRQTAYLTEWQHCNARLCALEELDRRLRLLVTPAQQRTDLWRRVRSVYVNMARQLQADIARAENDLPPLAEQPSRERLYDQYQFDLEEEVLSGR